MIVPRLTTNHSQPSFTPEQLMEMYKDAYKAKQDQKKFEKVKSLLRTGAENGHSLAIMELGNFCYEVSKAEEEKEVELGEEIHKTFTIYEKKEICNWLRQEEKKDNINASLLIARIEENQNEEKAILQSILDPNVCSRLDKGNTYAVYELLSTNKYAELRALIHPNVNANPNPANVNANPNAVNINLNPNLNAVNVNPNPNPNPVNVNPNHNPVNVNANPNGIQDEKACLNQIYAYDRMTFESAMIATKRGDLRAFYYIHLAYHFGKGTNENELEAINYYIQYKKADGIIPSRSDNFLYSCNLYKEVISEGTEKSLSYFREMMHRNFPLYEDFIKPSYATFPKPLVLDEETGQDLYSYLMNQDWIHYNPGLCEKFLIELAKQGFVHVAFPQKPGCEQTAENSEMFAVHSQFTSKDTYDIEITKIINEYAGFNMNRGNNLLFWKNYAPKYPVRNKESIPDLYPKLK